MSLKPDSAQHGIELPRAFFAYPSKPDIAETMRNGAQKINDCGVVAAKTWEGCKIGGKIIITEICNEIDRADLFCADMSGLNHNVMFELGFAIARNKRVWLAVDPSVLETKSDWNKLRILTTVGISDYCNSNEIRDKFLSDQPWLDTQNTIFKRAIEPSLHESKLDSLLYLKSRHSTEASTVISTEIAKSVTALGLRLIVDDPRETNVQPLSWYGEQVYGARAIVVHLINQGREGAHLHNAKYSFVAGLASGMNKDLLMLAQGDSLAPLDYRDLLKQYQTASEAANHLRGWLVPVIERVKQESNERQLYLSSIKLAQQLGQLKIGEPIAENEAHSLIEEYFVETTSYLEARDGRQSIFVGRKGAGKSANFLKLADALQADKRNIVCVVKRLSYEMQGIIELLRACT